MSISEKMQMTPKQNDPQQQKNTAIHNIFELGIKNIMTYIIFELGTKKTLRFMAFLTWGPTKT